MCINSCLMPEPLQSNGRAGHNTTNMRDLKHTSKDQLAGELKEAVDRVRELERTKVDQDALLVVLEGKDATIAAHEKTIADLEAKVKDLSQWPAIAHEMARNNTRLTGTLDNMAKAAAGLVPPAVMQAVNR